MGLSHPQKYLNLDALLYFIYLVSVLKLQRAFFPDNLLYVGIGVGKVHFGTHSKELVPVTPHA